MSTLQPIPDLIHTMARRARAAARQLATLSGAQKNLALNKIADALLAHIPHLLSENAKDLEAATRDNLAGPLLARLTLAEKKIPPWPRASAKSPLQTDPVGQTIEAYDRPNGLRIEKRRVPIGVVAIIFESRPNVTADAAGICLKSGNACILRGGKEAIHSNKAIAKIIQQGLAHAGISEDAVQLVETTDRAAVGALATAEGLIDLIIPRGGEGLIRNVVEQATIPVIKHYKGVCHVYIDKDADPDMAVKIAVSAKVDGVALCNTEECLLVHKDIAPKVLPRIATAFREKKVEMRADPFSLGSSRTPNSPKNPTGAPNSSTTSSPSNKSPPSTKPSTTSPNTAASTPTPSSPATSPPPENSPPKSTPPASSSTPPPASPTAANTASAPKSASPPTNSTPAAPWAPPTSAPTNTSSPATATSCA